MKPFQKIRRLQRKLSKTKKRSKNKTKQINRVSKLHYKISNIRKDALHKTTTFIANNYDFVAIEDLNVKGMVKNHNLARSITDIGFYEFRRQLKYKIEFRKTNLIIVDRFFPSSKMCSNCKKIKKDLSLKDRRFICDCSSNLDRDLNAAINLRNYIGKALPEFTPVEMTAMQKSVYPVSVTSIDEKGKQIPNCLGLGRFC